MTPTQESWHATVLQLFQLMKATFDCNPNVADWPPMHPNFKLHYKNAYRICNAVYRELEAGMSEDDMEELMDANSDLHKFLKAFFAMTIEERQYVMAIVQAQQQQKTTAN